MKFAKSGFATGILAGVLALMATTRAAGAHPLVLPVPKFNRVQVCTPFSVAIKPGADYSVSIDAEQSVKDALSAVVRDGTLTIATKSSFSTRSPIKLTVTANEENFQVPYTATFLHTHRISCDPCHPEFEPCNKCAG